MDEHVEESFVITYYGTGMSAQTKRFDNLEEAEAEFEKMDGDPRSGVYSLDLVRRLRVAKF